VNKGTPPRPRTFFLNEQHELAHAEKGGGGRPPQLGTIDWVAKSAQLSAAMKASKKTIQDSKDPLKGRHYFLVALPVERVPKLSTDKKKAPTGTFEEQPAYGGDHSRVFRRLGMDLIDVSDEGIATVHATTERFDRLLSTASALNKEGVHERARWVTIDRFDPVPSKYRVDDEWLQAVSKSIATDVVVELQPLLTRVEVEEVISAITSVLKRESGEGFTGTGTDFSGRRWFRGKMRRTAVREVTDSFFSIQSLHPPHVTSVTALPAHRKTPPAHPAKLPLTPDVGDLPVVAVLDTGIPAGHSELTPYRRGTYQHLDAVAAYAGNHGSLVASRVVFGDLDFSSGQSQRPPGTCRFLDVMVARDERSIEDKAIAPALEAVVATYPDVRVFNLSFGEPQPLASYAPVAQRERLLLVQDLDNFAFARDAIVVVAAGNSPPGAVPASDYPLHLDEPAWQLGAWPSGFNTLTCGATVETLHPDGLVGTIGWPSPFSRVGPGVAGGPVPEYGAHGGNLGKDWGWRASFGVWGCTDTGDWEDHAGTSFAAPLLAREAALAFHSLQGCCAPGGRPFAVTIKAFLALTAILVELPPPVQALADRTIGRGRASAARLSRPSPASAVFVWQGVIEGPADVARVQLPIPLPWLRQARQPRLRFVCSWDPPVNEAVRAIWACRRVTARLRPAPNAKAVHGTRSQHGSYPLIDRTYDLSAQRLSQRPTSDLWTIELLYEQTAEYYSGMTFAPQQRVAFAAELVDVDERPVSPQAAVQAMPLAATMIRLAVPPARLAVPIVIRSN